LAVCQCEITEIWSGRASEERTGKNTTGGPTVYCRACGFGTLKLKGRRAYTFGVCSQADQPRTESPVGKESGEWRSGYDKTEEHNIGSRQKENRGGAASEMGEGKGAAEEESRLATLDKKWIR